MLQSSEIVLISSYYSNSYILQMFLKVLTVYALIGFLLVGYTANRIQTSTIVETLSERVK